jgi:hypothetical protein
VKRLQDWSGSQNFVLSGFISQIATNTRQPHELREKTQLKAVACKNRLSLHASGIVAFEGKVNAKTWPHASKATAKDVHENHLIRL